MSIRATCPCGQAFLAKPELAGKTVKCPACGKAFQVPLAVAPDPLGPVDLRQMEFGSAPLPAARPAPLAAAPTYQAPRRAKGKGGGRGLVIGLIVAGAVVGGIMILVVLGALLLPAIQAARDAARRASGGGWAQYDSPAGGYSIDMPGKPRIETKSVPTAAGPITYTAAIVELGPKVAYTVAHSPLPAEVPNASMVLNAVAEGTVVQGMQGQVSGSRTLTVDGRECKEVDFTGTISRIKVAGRGRFILAGKTLYQVIYAGPPGALPESDLQRFFGSLKFTQGSPPTPPSPTPPPPPTITPPPTIAPPPTSPFEPPPAKPGELTDEQRKSIYRSVARYERLTETIQRQAEEIAKVGQKDVADQMLKNRADQRQNIVNMLAQQYQLTAAQIEEIYQTGKRENWTQ